MIPKDHPEAKCEECGGPNISWFAPSPVWNRAAPDNGILCPQCFVAKAEAAGIVSSWKLEPEFL